MSASSGEAGVARTEGREEMRERVRPAEVTPDDARVVLRGGPDTLSLLRSHARRVNRLFVLDGDEVWAISVLVALDEVGAGSADSLLRSKLRSYDVVYRSTVSQLLTAGFSLLPTFTRHQYSVVLPELSAIPALLEALGELVENPYALPQGG